MASQGQEQLGHSPEMCMKQHVQDGVENSKGAVTTNSKGYGSTSRETVSSGLVSFLHQLLLSLILCLKQITNENILYSTGKST